MNPTDDPKHPAESKPAEPKISSISPTLRRKLEPEYDDDEEVEGDSKVQNLLAIGLLVVILAIGGVLAMAMMRSKTTKETHTPAETTEAAAVADSAAADSSTASADSAGTPGHSTTPPAGASASATTPPPAATKPAAAPAKPAGTASRPAGTTPAAAAPAADAPPKVGHFGIAVATYLNEERAKSELARLGTATSLEGSVITVKEDGGDAFRVVLGDFPTRAAAEKKADELATSAAVREARVIALRK